MSISNDKALIMIPQCTKTHINIKILKLLTTLLVSDSQPIEICLPIVCVRVQLIKPFSRKPSVIVLCYKLQLLTWQVI